MGPWGRGPLPPFPKVWGRGGSSDSATARFCVPPLPPPDDCQCAFPIGKKEWEVNRGDRRWKRECVCEIEGEKQRVSYSENRVRDSSGGGERQLHRGFITAHCRGGETASQRSMLEQVQKWAVDEPTYDWKTRFTDGLLESAVRGGELCQRDGERTLDKTLTHWGKLKTMEMLC